MPSRRLIDGGIAGNERLTAAAGVLLIVLLAALGVTILRIRPLIWPHLFLGLALIGPVALKLGSTGYRFARYYSGNAVYRERGAPPTRCACWPRWWCSPRSRSSPPAWRSCSWGPASSGTLRGLHKASFIAWVSVTAIHVLAHMGDLSRTLLTRSEGRLQYNPLAAGRAGRTISLAGALLAGLVLAIVLIPHFGAWSQAGAFPHHDH